MPPQNVYECTIHIRTLQKIRSLNSTKTLLIKIVLHSHDIYGFPKHPRNQKRSTILYRKTPNMSKIKIKDSYFNIKAINKIEISFNRTLAQLVYAHISTLKPAQNHKLNISLKLKLSSKHYFPDFGKFYFFISFKVQ